MARRGRGLLRLREDRSEYSRTDGTGCRGSRTSPARRTTTCSPATATTNVLTGGGGNDLLAGAAGDDTLSGGVLACRDANRELNAAFAREGWPVYRTRFGLHTGEAVIGIIGSSDRMSYTALGATVNLAARLEPLNKQYGTDILVSDAVRQRVAHSFRFRAVDTITPKGFAVAVEVFELLGPAGLQPPP